MDSKYHNKNGNAARLLRAVRMRPMIVDALASVGGAITLGNSGACGGVVKGVAR